MSRPLRDYASNEEFGNGVDARNNCVDIFVNLKRITGDQHTEYPYEGPDQGWYKQYSEDCGRS